MPQRPGRLVLALAVAAVAFGLVAWLVHPLAAIGIAAVEVAALISAALDWREARLQIASLAQAWLVGHVTLLHRSIRRVRWHAAGLRLLWPTAAAAPVPAPRERPATLPVAVDERRAS